jgi:hypothetical protein
LDRTRTIVVLDPTPLGFTSSAHIGVRPSVAVIATTMDQLMKESLKMKMVQEIEPGQIAPITTTFGTVAHLISPLKAQEPIVARKVEKKARVGGTWQNS